MCSYPLIIKSDKRSPGTWAVRLVKTWSLLERVQSFDNGIIISDRIVEWKMGVLLVETTRAVTKTMQKNIVRENDMELFFSCYRTIDLLLAVQLDQRGGGLQEMIYSFVPENCLTLCNEFVEKMMGNHSIISSWPERQIKVKVRIKIR